MVFYLGDHAIGQKSQVPLTLRADPGVGLSTDQLAREKSLKLRITALNGNFNPTATPLLMRIDWHLHTSWLRRCFHCEESMVTLRMGLPKR